MNHNSAGDDAQHFDAEWYTSRYPDVELSGIDPLKHYQEVGRFLDRLPCEHYEKATTSQDARERGGDFLPDRSLFGHIDFPPAGDFVGHDYIRVIGWCYIHGEEIESVHGEVAGSKKSTALRASIFRPDVANVYPQLNFSNVGFQGDLYPHMNGTNQIEIKITAKTVSGSTHVMHRSLEVDPSVKEPPANRHVATSELMQHINESKIF